MELYAKVLAIIKHRVATRKDIKHLLNRGDIIIEITKNGENAWIIGLEKDYEKYLTYKKVFIATEYFQGIEKRLLGKDYPRKVYIAIFINNNVKIINPWIIKNYEDPEKALRTIIENGA